LHNGARNLVQLVYSPSSSRSISSFGFGIKNEQDSISQDSITIIVPAGTDVTKIAPIFTTTGSFVTVNSIQQTQDTSDLNNQHDFTGQVIYEVHAANGSTRDYYVNVQRLFNYMLNNNTKKYKGFTLIELIVVMSVFLFIIGAAIGIFIAVVQNQKQVLSEQELLNQISYTQEYMSKALRVAEADSVKTDPGGNCLIYEGTDGTPLGSNNLGYIYLLTRHDISTGFFRGIKFINSSAKDACQEFFLDADGVLKEIKNGAAAVSLTPSDLQINYVRFFR